MKKIDLDIGEKSFFGPEIKRAIDWLIRICDQKEFGWAWVPLIAPNIQNTSEVICAAADLVTFLDDGEKRVIQRAIERWLLRLDREELAKISIDWSWALLALQKTRECHCLCSEIDKDCLQNSIDVCVKWLMENQNPDGGYADNIEEKSATTRTALALWALSIEDHYVKKVGGDRYEGIEHTIKKAKDWLLESQHSDGGWGNIRKRDVDVLYQKKDNLTYSDLKFQTDSNPACTGYAMVALKYCSVYVQQESINKAYHFLRNSQNPDGSWDLFLEVGVRDGVRYTFRHFSTTWALRGIILNIPTSFNDEMVIYGFNYLSRLQDDNFGGWRCSIDADNYTWSTTNAIVTINLIRDRFDKIKANGFLSIVVEWWNLKKNEANYSFRVKDTIFAFNNATGLLFCMVFSVMMFVVMFFGVNALKGLLENRTEQMNNISIGSFMVVMSIVLGLPWVVYVKNRFNSEIESWINSIGWVYGIITGFVLAFFQLLL